MVGHIQHSGKLLIHILNDILDVSKLQVGAVSIEQRPFNIGDLLLQIQASHNPKCVERGLTLTVDIQPEATGYWLGDSYRVDQIVQNVLGNAIKFTETGSVSVSVSGVKDLCLTVEDSGIGMTQSQIAVMFDEFTQADDGIARRFGGTGLGMAIAHRLVTMMDGTIEVESQLGQGSIVTICLPLQRAEMVVVAPAEVAQTTPAEVAKIRVLCADDTKSNLLVLGAMLHYLGIEAQMADNGHAAIQMAEQHGFDIYLLDISMPELSGIETLQGLRKVEMDRGRSRGFAVAVTANVLSFDVLEYLQSGFDAHLPKPIRIEALQSILLACQDELLIGVSEV